MPLKIDCQNFSDTEIKLTGDKCNTLELLKLSLVIPKLSKPLKSPLKLLEGPEKIAEVVLNLLKVLKISLL